MCNFIHCRIYYENKSINSNASRTGEEISRTFSNLGPKFDTLLGVIPLIRTKMHIAAQRQRYPI